MTSEDGLIEAESKKKLSIRRMTTVLKGLGMQEKERDDDDS